MGVKMKSQTCIGKACQSWKPVFETHIGVTGKPERTDKIIEGAGRCSSGDGLTFCKPGVPCDEVKHGEK